MRACPGVGAGLAIVEEMNRDDAGPVPPLISAGRVRIGAARCIGLFYPDNDTDCAHCCHRFER
jgi:hypothetical protein